MAAAFMASDRAVRRRLATLAWLSLVAACQEGIHVTVEQDAGKARFIVTPVAERFRTCIRTVNVYDPQTTTDRKAPIWHLERRDPRVCVASLEFGVVPQGFEGDPPTVRLRPGTRYEVALMGPGFNDGTEFIAQ